MKKTKRIALLRRLCLIPALVTTAHGANGPKIKSVLVISIDGMHSQDLAKWVQAHPSSTLAQLSATSVNYTNAFTTKPSDSIPSTVGIFTGGSPAIGGMYYDDAFNRSWFAPTNLACTGAPGAVIDLKQGINAAPIDGSGGVDPAKMPRQLVNGVCSPVLPHDMMRLNTVFEVVKAAGLRTAYSEKRPSYDILNGPSGTGVQDLYTPEIACFPFTPPTGCNNALLSPTTTETFDQLRVNSILNEINNLNSAGTAHAPVPALFGMNFQAVNSAKKASTTSGYADTAGNPDALLLDALTYVDTAIGSMVFAMREQGLLNNTAIVITAKHGEAPVGNVRTVVPTTVITSILKAALISTNKVTQKTSALIWLSDQTQTAAAVAALNASSTLAPNLSAVLSFGSGLPFPNPLSDAAPPDIVVVMKDGVNFEPSPITVFAEHGGFGENETHVPLMVSNPKWTGLTQGATVSTTQIAPTVLSLLGLSPQDLLAVRIEGTQSLSDVLVQ